MRASNFSHWRDVTLLVLAGLAIRLLWVREIGHAGDIDAFERWATSLAAAPWNAAYEVTDINYPPAAVLIFELVGRAYRSIEAVDPHRLYLRIAVKLPAILFDLLGGYVIYALARRRAGHWRSLGATALFVLNPAIVYDSAYWGQNDSITAVSALGAVLCLLRGWRTVAWGVLAFAVLNKPPVFVLAPLFALESLRADGSGLAERLLRTAKGLVCALVVTYVLAVPFFTDQSFLGVFWRLWFQFANGSSLYQFNSVNAFNWYALFGNFFVSDQIRILGVPMKLWGDLVFLAALALIAYRYVRLRTEVAFLEACMLTMLAFFMFLTEMHERYLIYALAFVPVLALLERRYLWAACVLTVTMWLNLEYAVVDMSIDFAKQHGSTINLNPTEYAPVLVHLCALANLGVFAVCLLAALHDDAALRRAPHDRREPAESH